MYAIPAVLLHPLASTPAQHLRPKEVGHENTGRACAPWLIAQGRSLDVPRLDRVALHHSSFGSDAGSARFATILVELGIANPSDWEACAGEPAKFLRRTLARFVRRACGDNGSQQDSASLHETKATGRQGLEGHGVADYAQEPSSTSAESNSRAEAGVRQGKAAGDPGARPRTVLRLQSSSSGPAGDLSIG